MNTKTFSYARRAAAALCVLAVSLLTACDLETSDNGPLDGFWQLTAIDTLSTGGTSDMRQQRIFWSFQGRLMQARRAYDMEGVYFSFRHQGDSLVLAAPYLSKRELGDVAVDSAEVLYDYAVHDIPARYQVLKLSGSAMRLRGTRYCLHFRKY